MKRAVMLALLLSLTVYIFLLINQVYIRSVHKFPRFKKWRQINMSFGKMICCDTSYRKVGHLATTYHWNISDFVSASYIFFCAKMSSFEPNKYHLRELLIYFFNLKKSAAEAHLVEAYGEVALSERSCREWFQKFNNGEFEVGYGV